MRHKLAEWLNQYGNVTSDAGNLRRAENLYKLASKLVPQWSVPWYNLGLLTKNAFALSLKSQAKLFGVSGWTPRAF
jgi:hypothetical protein